MMGLILWGDNSKLVNRSLSLAVFAVMYWKPTTVATEWGRKSEVLSDFPNFTPTVQPQHINVSHDVWLSVAVPVTRHKRATQETTAYVINDAGAKACLEAPPGDQCRVGPDVRVLGLSLL